MEVPSRSLQLPDHVVIPYVSGAIIFCLDDTKRVLLDLSVRLLNYKMVIFVVDRIARGVKLKGQNLCEEATSQLKEPNHINFVPIFYAECYAGDTK